MMPSDLLLQLVTQLVINSQKDVSVVHGRRILLDYIRKSTGAGRGLLFTLDTANQVLGLLERSGRGPRHVARPEVDPQRIPLHGLFAQALRTQGLLDIPDAYSDPRSLQEEQYWAWPGGHVILSAVEGTGEHNRQRGVLVLCFHPGQKEWHNTGTLMPPGGGPFLISIVLLSAYLVESDKDASTGSSRGKPIPVGASAKGLLVGTPDFQREHSLGYKESPTINRGATQGSRYASAENGVQLQNALDEIMSILSRLDEQRITEQKALIEQERNRIAREIHDGVAQQIAHAMYKLEFIQRTFEKQPQAALHDLALVYDMLKESLHDLRRGIASLIPLPLERQDFDAALRELFKSYEPGLEIRYDADYADMLPPSLEVPVFRFIQEALSNVRKHAQASHVAIRIRALSGLLLVQISDNGKGFLPKQVTRSAGSEQHVGLRAMGERIEQAGGNLEIRSKPAEGTVLKARFPLTTPAVLLTRREREVLDLLVDGSTNRVIAQKLSVSIETVKSHVRHIMQKMHVKDRTQAAVIATRQRWL